MAHTDHDEDAPALAIPGRDDSSGPLPAVPDENDRALPPATTEPDRLPVRDQEPGPPVRSRSVETAQAVETVEPVEPVEDPSVELPRFVQPDHALGPAERTSPARPPAESEPPTSSARRGRRAAARDEGASAPMVSGDPLLTGPTPVVERTSARSDDAGGADRTGDAAPPVAPPTVSAQPPGPPPPPRRQRSEAPPPPPRSASPRVTAPAGPAAGALVTGIPGGNAGRTARRASRGASVSTQQPVTASTRPVDHSRPIPTLRATTVAPVPRMAGRRPRVRRVTRVVRHVDPWSVFKVAAVFSAVAYTISLVAGVLLWNVAYSTGTIDNIERGMESTGWAVFELEGGEIFHNAWIGGLFIAVGLTGLAVLVATLFNLITDLVGGVRFTVLEEEVIEKTASPMRRFATRRDDGQQTQQQAARR